MSSRQVKQMTCPDAYVASAMGSIRHQQTHVIPIYLDDIKFVGVPVDLIGVRFKFDPQDPD